MSDYRERIYHLKGSPFEIGSAMGRALGPKMEANIERYIRERTAHAPFDADRWRLGAIPWLRNLPPRFREEFEGLAQGSGLPLERIAAWAYLEVILSSGCSGAIVMLDGQAWVARNNDIFVPGMWGYATIREVTGRIPAISFGLEGDVFTPTGMNREKLWLHYNYLPVWDALGEERSYLPCYAFMVEALETCRNLKDVEALLLRIPRDEGMLLFAVDGKDNTFALYECTCSDFYKREATQGWLVGTNHYCVHPKAPAPGGSGPRSTVRRYDRLVQLVEGLITQRSPGSPVDDFIRILSDEGVEARDGEIVTAYSNVACPATQEIWFTFGGYPSASQGNWQKLAGPW
jgi:hypothetical protein